MRISPANIWSSPRVMASADLSGPRGRTQYPYARLKLWPRSGPPLVSSARVHMPVLDAVRRAVRLHPRSVGGGGGGGHLPSFPLSSTSFAQRTQTRQLDKVPMPSDATTRLLTVRTPNEESPTDTAASTRPWQSSPHRSPTHNQITDSLSKEPFECPNGSNQPQGTG